jgi:Kef-type K+ transport system membrane component KefB
MTNYIILALCIIVILSYIFDITSKYSKIPSVIFLISLGIGIQILGKSTGVRIPNMQPLLPVIGTLGLILIIMEASMDLKLEERKKRLIIKSISSAFILLASFTTVFTYFLVEFYDFSIRDSLLNSIPLSIISSSVAIPSALFLNSDEKDFIVYESSFSDIFGIIIFDFILASTVSIGLGIINFAFNSLLTIIIALITSSILAILLHKIRYHINYVIIMTAVVLVYIIAKISHLPALLLVLTFGLVLSNNKFLENTPIKRVVDFVKFRNDLESFKTILVEITFIVRSFFFIIFGYYTKIEGLFSFENLFVALVITLSIFALRFLFFKLVLKIPIVPLFFFSPRGLITILLFLNIPIASRIPFISEEVVTLVILLTIFILMIGNIIHKREHVMLKT